ncbi:hypothetical protein CV093_15500 [Oceanobacillus sp. 143]|nr:hypothetical protein CV093_15500 [Oceanobacillus sp. 143]
MAIDFLLDHKGNPNLFYIKGWENKNFLREANKDSWDTFIQNSFHYLFFCIKIVEWIQMQMTWINIQQAENNSEKNIIFMPSFLSDGLSSNVQLSFGQRRIKAIVKTTTSQSIEVNDYSNPMQIYLSANLLNELLVQTEITYQLKIHDNECTIGPIIGLHLGEQQYYYHNRHMKQYIDSMHDYQSIGGLIIAFKDGSIDETENCVYGLYYHDRKKQWRYGKFPLPSVIFRRAYKTTQDLADRLYKKRMEIYLIQLVLQNGMFT